MKNKSYIMHTADICEACFMKRGLNATAKNFDTGQFAQFVQADLNLNILLSFICLLHSLPNNPDYWRPSERNILKTLREKEKMLVTSIFSFSLNVFHPVMDRNNYFSNI